MTSMASIMLRIFRDVMQWAAFWLIQCDIFYRISNTEYQYLECWHYSDITETLRRLKSPATWLVVRELVQDSSKMSKLRIFSDQIQIQMPLFLLLWCPVLSLLKWIVMQKMSSCLNIMEWIADQLLAYRWEYSIYYIYLSCIKCTGHDLHVLFV